MKSALTFIGRFGGIVSLLLFAGAWDVRGESKETKSESTHGDLQFEAHLVWAATNNVSPNPKHKPVSPEIAKKLGELPLKWKNYFECNQKSFGLSKQGTTKVEMSKKCLIEVRHVDGKKVEVSLLGKGGEALIKRSQPLPKGDYFVLAGNAPGAAAWFVILKRIK